MFPRDPRFAEENAEQSPNLERDLQDTQAVLTMFKPKDRTTLRDLLPALMEIDSRLQKYQPAKGDQWRTNSINYHMEHALMHLSDAMDAFTIGDLMKNLAAAGLRCMMALTCTVKRGWMHQGSLVSLKMSVDRISE